jgi:ankyrin repeat protein
MRVASTFCVLLLPLVLLATVFALAPVPAPQPGEEVAGLIEQLAALRHDPQSGIADPPTWYRHYFGALDTAEESLAVQLRHQGPRPSDVLREIVKRGAAAVPHLIAHLDDRRETDIKVWDQGWVGAPDGPDFRETTDYNPRTTSRPAVKNNPDEPDRNPGNPREPHTITLGDLCFVALGQIVNRDFCAVSLKNHFTINTDYFGVNVVSPTHSPAVLATVRREWGNLTRAQHRAALIADFQQPDHVRRWVGACRRLAYYYPDSLEALVLPELVPETNPKELTELIEGALLDDHNVRIDRAVRDLLVVTADTHLALACMKRLLGRGYDADIERQCRLRGTNARGEPRPYHEKFQAMAGKLGWTPAHVAVERQDVDGLRELIRQGRNIDVKDRQGRTPARLAIQLDRDDLVRLLVKHGAAVSDILIAASAGKCEQARAFVKADPASLKVQNERECTPLYLAVRRGDVAMASLLLEAGAEPDTPGEQIVTPLDLTIYRGDVSMGRLLLEHGAVIDRRRGESTPLLHAIEEQRPAMVRLLLEFKPRLDMQLEGSCWTPLLSTAESGQREVVRMLLDAGASVNLADKSGCTALHCAVLRGDEVMTRLLLAYNADPVASCRHNDHELCLGLEWQPIHLAARRGDRGLVELLAEHGADVSAVDRNDNLTPLHLAAFAGSAETVRYLLAHGAKVDAPGFEGSTPLHQALVGSRVDLLRCFFDYSADIRSGKQRFDTMMLPIQRKNLLQVVRLLLDHGANANARPDLGALSPLLVAVAQKDADLVRLLLSRGAKVDLADPDERTPLNYAVSMNAVDVARALLEGGANPCAIAWRAEDVEPLHIAAGHKDGKAMVELLLAHKADVNARERSVGREQQRGRTPLHVAVEANNAEVVEVLLAHGADWTIEDSTGRTALDLARKGGDPAILALFRQRGGRE